MRVNKNINRDLLWLSGALLVTAAIRIILVQGGLVPFNSDEAVVGLMARHILQGERPIFFYGQAYMGSLDAFLVAAGFYLLGQEVWVIRLVQGILYLGVMISTYHLGHQVFMSRKTGLLAAGLLAVPTVNVMLYTTASLGGYGEALLIGNLVMLTGLRIVDKLAGCKWTSILRDWVLFGFLCGLGLWAFGLTLVYSVPTCLFLAVQVYAGGSLNSTHDHSSSDVARIQRLPLRFLWISTLVFAMGFLVGSLPLWIFAVNNGVGQIAAELGGQAIRGVEGMPWLNQVLQHLLTLVLFGGTVAFGMRPPWSAAWLGLPVLPFILVFWISVLLHTVRYFRRGGENNGRAWLLVGVVLAVVIGFVFTPFGADPSGRYFVPLIVPFVLFAAHFIIRLVEKYGVIAYGLAVMLVVYHLWGIGQGVLQSPHALTTQFYEPARIDHSYDRQLIEFLLDHGETRGFSNYWVSYPLAFLSDEEIIFIPRLPYHPDFRFTLRDDRYALYAQAVEEAHRVAYITTRHAALDAKIREGLANLEVSWKENSIGDYRIFYELSRVVQPDEIFLPMVE